MDEDQKTELLERLVAGESLRRICRDKHMPTTSTVMKYVNHDEAFAEQYARAKQMGIEVLIDEIIEIADTEDDAAKARNRIEARKWTASKLVAKKYGDKSSVDVTSGGEPIALEPLDVARRVAFLLTSGAKAAEK